MNASPLHLKGHRSTWRRWLVSAALCWLWAPSLGSAQDVPEWESGSPRSADTSNDGEDLFATEEETWHDRLPLRIWLSAGFGIAMHANEVPGVQGVDRVNSAIVPGMQLGATVEGAPGKGLVAAGLRLQYRTSLGYELTRTEDRQVRQTTPARAQHMAMEAVVRLDLASGEDGLSIPIFVGASITDFSTEVPFTLLEYGFVDVHVRPSLRVTLLDGSFRLTIGPSLGTIVYAAEGLADRKIERSGLVFGAEAELQVRVFGHLFLQARYLEQRAQLSEQDGPRTLIDQLRAVTGGVALAY